MRRIVLAATSVLLVSTPVPAQQPVEAHSVVLCEHADLIASCKTCTVEPWKHHKLVTSLGDLNEKISSLRVGPQVSVTLELNSNRPGQDYRDFDLPQANPESCRDACSQDPRCRAFTYVKPGIQGEYARCWLKDSVPPAEHAPCCASGVKQ